MQEVVKAHGGQVAVQHECYNCCASFLGDKASMDNGVLKAIWASVKPVALDKLITSAHTEGLKIYICSTAFIYE